MVRFARDDRPAGFKAAHADRYATTYCQALNFSRGRALQVTSVPESRGRFAYAAVDQVICFN